VSRDLRLLPTFPRVVAMVPQTIMELQKRMESGKRRSLYPR
jgi:hypothetical protein